MKRAAVTRVIALASLVLLSAPCGCAANATDQPVRAPEPQRAYIAASCPALKQQPPGAVPVGIYLTVEDVAEPIGVPVKSWLAAHPVELHSGAKLLVPIAANAPSPCPFGFCLDRACSKREDATLQVIVTRPPTDAASPVELQLNLSSANLPPRVLSIKTTDQEPIVATLATTPVQTLVVTPYYLFEPKHHSLGLLLECELKKPRTAGLPESEQKQPAAVPPLAH